MGTNIGISVPEFRASLGGLHGDENEIREFQSNATIGDLKRDFLKRFALQVRSAMLLCYVSHTRPFVI
jgi:hypothetical protein